MHSTRIATFLLGAWMACCLLADVVLFMNPRLPDRLLAAPAPAAANIIKTAGADNARLLLRHFAMEQDRYYLANWTLAQIGVAVILLALLFFALDHRILPLVLGAGMLILVMFQAFALSPELTFRGREVDFPPGSLAVGAQARLLILNEIFIAVEAVKLTVGAVLSLYIFVYKSRRRVRAEDPADLGRPAALRRV